MPHVRDGEALDQAFVDLEALAADMGEPPWRVGLVGTSGMRVVLLAWLPGFSTIPHLHPNAEETFLVIRGRAAFTIGDEPEREVGPGALLLAARGVRHVIRVPERGQPLLLLATVGPNEDRPDETIEPA
jgi:mannose-6-phosphate isomerase-like protein (cupin superfamily)